MFTLKNIETNTITNFRPWSDGTLVFVEQIHDGEYLGIQADMLVEEAREFWRKCIKNGAVK
tara:strand:- start:546 stop:728 length:183 start_codon:yes stop_codon:yes gene_type:complete